MPVSLARTVGYALLSTAGIYGVILALFVVPQAQSEFLFLNRLNFPLDIDYERPESLGLAPFNARNLRLNTTDGESLGAWHILPRSIYTSLEPFPPHGPLSSATFDDALGRRPTVIYFHGNAGNRGTRYRIRTYIALSGVLDCNVLTIDYRGYGDSTGKPSEQGLVEDAQTAWDYVSTKVKDEGITKPESQITLVGHSLGTGVLSGLAARLASKGISPRALVLIAPFSSLQDVLRLYRLFFVIPLLGPLKWLPSLQDFFLKHMGFSFDSKTALATTTAPTLLLHAVNDLSIPHLHSSTIFHSLLSPNTSVEKVDYPHWGTLSSFKRTSAGEVVRFEALHGGHNNIAWTEGAVDLIARIARLP